MVRYEILDEVPAHVNHFRLVRGMGEPRRL